LSLFPDSAATVALTKTAHLKKKNSLLDPHREQSLGLSPLWMQKVARELEMELAWGYRSSLQKYKV